MGMLSNKEFKMSAIFKEFGMFTDAGNDIVGDIVDVAKSYQLSWKATYALLQAVAKDERFGEALDTAVREYVYDACGFESEFYI
jgi:hypothetical protein